MPIGTSKIGVLGAGTVPGGSETFNAPGTFSVPPGVTRVNITGRGGTGNPGNAGNPGNPGNAGSGGGGGGGGGRGPNNQPGYVPFNNGGFGGARFNTEPFTDTAPVLPTRGNPGNFNCCNNTGSAGGAGGGGTAGNAGSAGSAGNAGTSGNASSTLCKTFPGGAGGNAGAAGNAGTSGSAGTGGAGAPNGGGPAPGNAPVTTSGASGVCGGGSGGTGYDIRNQGKPNAGAPGGPFYVTGGGGGGGAGITNSGQTGVAGSFRAESYFAQEPYATKTNIAFGGNSPMSAPAPNVSRQNNTAAGTIPSNMTGGTGDILSSVGGGNAVTVIPNAVNQAPSTNRPGFANFSGPCVPSVIRSGAGGGSGGYINANPCSPGYPPGNMHTAGGGAGGGRGGAAGAGGNSTGGSGSAGTPSTFNCVTVTPGGSVPVTVGGPSGGQIVISWNPQ